MRLLNIITIIISMLLFFSKSYAYENYNECEILRNKIENFFSKLSLDEPFIENENIFGIDIDYHEDGSKEIISVHQDLSDQIYNEYDEAVLYFTTISHINGKSVDQLSDTEFDEEFLKNEITIKVNEYEHTFKIIRSNYSTIKIEDLVIDLLDISNINTKLSQFDALFTIQTIWRDNRYLEIANQIYNDAPNNENVGFFCSFQVDYFDNKNLFYPKLYPQRFMTKRDDIIRKIVFYYYPPSSDKQKDEGIVEFTLYENYLGTINDRFPVQKFPFDTQLLRFTIEPDRVNNLFYHLDILDSGKNEYYLSKSIYKLYNPEWEFLEAYKFNDYSLDPETDQYFTTLIFDYEVKRKSLYYIYKLMIPIIFLIILSGMVFFIKIKELQGRLTISVVCFLSLIAYIFVVDDELPKLGYLTFIDIFILISYMFSGIPTLQTVIVEYISENKNINVSYKIDKYFRRFYFLGYVAALLILLIVYDIF